MIFVSSEVHTTPYFMTCCKMDEILKKNLKKKANLIEEELREPSIML